MTSCLPNESNHDLLKETSAQDPRVHVPVEQIVYRNLYNFRLEQLELGAIDNTLTDTQWGLVTLDRCHHISITANGKDGPQSYRVRICKTCCHENCHIELGTYADQESAILVNDAFEIMHQRTDKLLVLRAEDQPYLHRLMAKKVDRVKGKEYSSIIELIGERAYAVATPSSESRKRKSIGSQEDLDDSVRKQRTLTFSVDPDAPTDDVSYHPSLSSGEGMSDCEDNVSSEPTATASTSPSHSAAPIVEDPVDLAAVGHAHHYARQRAYTFSTAADYSTTNRHGALYQQLFSMAEHPINPMDTLTWLASLEDAEVDVARSLFAMKDLSYRSNDSSSSKVLSLSNPSQIDARDMEGEEGVAEKLLMLSSSAKKELLRDQPDDTPLTSHTTHADEDEEDEEQEEDDQSEGDGMGYCSDGDQARNIHALARASHQFSRESALRLNNHSPTFPASFRGRRGRANSMSILERPMFDLLPPLNLSSPGDRSKGDLLALVLKKFADRGSVPGKGYIGIYSPEDRKLRIERFLEKRKNRIWAKKVKYDVRKNFADSRIRVKGRFVKKDEEQAAIVLAFTEKAAKATGSKSVASNFTKHIYIPKNPSRIAAVAGTASSKAD